MIGFNGDHVRFLYKNYRDGDREKVMELEADEFLRRFLLHVLPERFVRIRHRLVFCQRSRSGVRKELYRWAHVNTLTANVRLATAANRASSRYANRGVDNPARVWSHDGSCRRTRPGMADARDGPWITSGRSRPAISLA